MTDRAIRSVVVVGGGIVALSAAAAFARSLPQVDVVLVETPIDPAALTDLLPGSQPSIARFHALIGLDEAELIATGAATWRIGTCFRNWSASGADWYHVTGECGPRLGTIAFHNLWARAARSGETLPYHAFAAAGVLAEAGKFVMPVGEATSPFASYDYALRLSPRPYREALSRRCNLLRVTRLESSIISPERDANGFIRGIALDDSRRLIADVYVDCSGPSARLHSTVDGEYEDWSGLLPLNRISMRQCSDPPAAVDNFERTRSGWLWRAPGVGSGRVSAADVRLQAGEEWVEIKPGRRQTPWVRNVLAIGDAAVALDPLGWFGLPLAHLAIERAIDLLPDRECSRVELAEYNRRMAEDVLAARDQVALFYHCSNGPAGDYWDRAARLSLPDSLVRRVEQFRRSGYLVSTQDQIDRESWVAALIGLGYLPTQTSALADAISPEMCDAAMGRWRDGIAAIVSQVPEYKDYLANTLRDLHAPAVRA